ncbi:hypothetical protein [Burkholderia stagnalis]|uniref:hypothetical protein n=1 Tax=Burkholderia stagnalis TaxID=1503054 RepID=UPI000F5C95FF|nr:hypothetical protein [Burkholderia stagnalis]RQY25352.1 hypothetical protein DF117_05885 [Burkholderia stagnalis]RQZ01493.1 hypothetical protein DF106_04255 [Burkholderia stagnalis]RQZ07070.1 hypothetical protein DF105_06595 [Burkholderia stagnalis]
MAKLRCRPGDLAIVTKCALSERIGLLVRVLERDLFYGCDWLIEMQGQPILSKTVRSNEPRLCRKAVAYDWNMTPIRGDAVDHELAIGEPHHV